MKRINAQSLLLFSLVGLLLVGGMFFALTYKPTAPVVMPFVIMDECKALDWQADTVPDVLACPGAAYSVHPLQ